MASWSELLNIIKAAPVPLEKLDEIRKETLKKISEHTGRNTITYYSGWLTKPLSPNVDINDSDMNAFMQAIYKIDKSKGLNLILHTPGGNIAAAESIVDYLHKIFNDNIHAIIPHLSMSAGTMIALSCSSIMMGKHSSLGPIDPQLNGISCQESLDEFEQAKKEVKGDTSCLGLWQVRIDKYTPTFLISCENAIEWSKLLAKEWVEKNPNIKNEKEEDIMNLFVEHSSSKSHSRHIPKDKCKDAGLNIVDMEDDGILQDLILTLHHCYMIMFDISIIVKAVENQNGASLFRTHQPISSNPM